MKIKVKVSEARAQEAFKRAPVRMRQLVSDALWRGALEVTRDARDRAPKAFSTLTQSIRPEKINDLHWRAAPGVNYARPVEEGRMPMRRMPGAGLMEWVKLKTGLQGKALDRATFAIARAIGRRGIDPQPYMKPAAEAKESRVVDLVRAAVARGADEVMA